MVLVDRCGTGVVGGQSQREVVVIAGEQRVEVGGAPAHILVGLEAVLDAKVAAVPGISCIRPRAPARLTARALPPLSAFTTLASRSTSRLCSWPALVSISLRSAGDSLRLCGGDRREHWRRGQAVGGGGSGTISTDAISPRRNFDVVVVAR